ncbi:MAG TPA: hypothetical protein VNI83_04130 [Vicinamibacterales bacterium]|nr:hypothetical protein [Vicinamibacterales bacterium]
MTQPTYVRLCARGDGAGVYYLACPDRRTAEVIVDACRHSLLWVADLIENRPPAGAVCLRLRRFR